MSDPTDPIISPAGLTPFENPTIQTHVLCLNEAQTRLVQVRAPMKISSRELELIKLWIETTLIVE